MGGLWFAYYMRQLKGRPLISLQDARLETAFDTPAQTSPSGPAPEVLT